VHFDNLSARFIPDEACAGDIVCMLQTDLPARGQAKVLLGSLLSEIIPFDVELA
jgi:hypothetical protein